MRNHILLNNNNSMNIRGLLIQSLPPISLPKMRTRTEEIDGRDGDIITRLGYSAYDKTIKIGLTYNYDVDEVIAYFNNNSSGEVVFSNESDKIYRYELLDQIDFERLLRFKEAEVTFHVQPYKYDYNGTVKDETTFPITVHNSGNVPSKPILTIYATGTITVSLNGNEIFSIVMGDNEYIEIDTEQMNAYMGGVLLNRNVTGDYSQFALLTGDNTLSFTGSVTNVLIDRYSRWI